MLLIVLILLLPASSFGLTCYPASTSNAVRVAIQITTQPSTKDYENACSANNRCRYFVYSDTTTQCALQSDDPLKVPTCVEQPPYTIHTKIRNLSAKRARRNSESCLEAEKKEEHVLPTQLTVQGLCSARRNEDNQAAASSDSAFPFPARNASRTSPVPAESMPERPEDYMRYLSNLSTVTINRGREFRNVPAYLQQFEMSRRGTITTMSRPVRRRMSVVEQTALPTDVPEKPPNRIKNCFRGVLSKHREFGLRHFLLALALALYATGGMFLFYAIEMPYERENVVVTRDALNEALNAFANDLESAATIPEANMTLLLKKAYIALLKIDGKYTGSTFYKLEDREDYISWTWTHGTAFFFAFTLYSTVGYGSIFPSTDLGRVMVIFYTAIGFPCALVIIRDLGSVLLVYLTRIYAAIVVKMRTARGYDPSSPYEGIRLPMKVAFLISVTYVALTALFVHAYDAWLGPEPPISFFHSFYFTFLSFAAVGLGDLMPTNYAHAPVVAITFLISMPLMRVVNRVLYVGIENRMYGSVALVEESIDRIAPEREVDRLSTVAAHVEMGRNSGDSLSALDEDGRHSEDDDEEQNRIHNELMSNFTLRSVAAIPAQKGDATKHS